jgi:hypothetical protein
MQLASMQGENMDDFGRTLAKPANRIGSDLASSFHWAVGSRFIVRSRGKYSRCLEGRTGLVIGFAHTKSALRVVLDGQKHPQTLHRCYLELVVEATLEHDTGSGELISGESCS